MFSPLSLRTCSNALSPSIVYLRKKERKEVSPIHFPVLTVRLYSYSYPPPTHNVFVAPHNPAPSLHVAAKKMREKQSDERLHDQPWLKVSVWRESPAGGRVLDFALLFEGVPAITRDSESFPRQIQMSCSLWCFYTHARCSLSLAPSLSLSLLYSSTYVFPVPVGP